jgi:hypothetical protein
VPDRDDDAPQPAAGGPDEAALAIVARHALHDEELVAAYAAGALDGEEDADDHARARGFVERCPTCRAVHDDVAAIVGAARTEAQFTITAPRDYRLTVEDAVRLGGTVASRGVFARFARALVGAARPVGASMAALGLVGVLVGSAVLGAAGVAKAPASDSNATTGGAAAMPSSAPAAGPSTFEAAMTQTDAPKASERTAVVGPTTPTFTNDALTPDTGGWLLGISIVVVVLGALLFFAGVRSTRRRPAGPQGP